MKAIRNIYWSVFFPLRIFDGGRREGKLFASILVVLVTVFFGSVVFPILYYLKFRNRFTVVLNMESTIRMLLTSILTWVCVCGLFWLISRLFKKNVSFGEIVSTWGYSYVPNFICLIAYNGFLHKTGLFTGNPLLGFLMNTLFIMLLVWKAIYFFIELKYILNTNGMELFITTGISGIVFVLLMWLGFSVGIQVPML